MNDWTGGYVSDVEYLPGFYREQAPAQLDLACLICGIEPPRAAGVSVPFTYCEIGCGQGTTIAALAASNPEGRFWGIDFMPAHIARAEAFRAQAELNNLTFVEADVVALADTAGSDLPQFDYVTLHGVYTWVSPEVRAGIVRFLNRFVKPGGVVYVGYNTLPGWQQLAAAQKLLLEFSRSIPGDSITRVQAGIERMREVVTAGTAAIQAEGFDTVFSAEPSTRLAEDRVTYLAHEFLNGHWHPMYHMDAARELAGAKLDFVGVAALVENFAGVGLTDAARQVVDSQPPGSLRETLRDFYNSRVFRRDVFVRGRRTLDDHQRESRLREIMLALAHKAPPPDYAPTVLGTKLTLNAAVYGPIFNALENGVTDIAKLIETGRAAGGQISAMELVGILVGTGIAFAVQRDVTLDGVAACRRHNAVTAHHALGGNRQIRHAIAVPVGHSGNAVGLIEIGVLDGLLRGLPEDAAALTAHVLERARVAPDEVRANPNRSAPTDTDKSSAVDDPSRTMGERVRQTVDAFMIEMLPHWKKLGLLDRGPSYDSHPTD